VVIIGGGGKCRPGPRCPHPRWISALSTLNRRPTVRLCLLATASLVALASAHAPLSRRTVATFRAIVICLRHVSLSRYASSTIIFLRRSLTDKYIYIYIYIYINLYSPRNGSNTNKKLSYRRGTARCVTSPEQIEVMELEGYSGTMQKTQQYTGININKTKATTKSIKSNDTLY